jgi:diguanylate cyclase (GGDEF)-like protein
MSAKILLVEDNKAQAGVVLDYLQEKSHEVTWVADGKAAIKMAATRPFDIVLLDLVLPDMHGNQICRWLKQHKDTRTVPIIMLTAMDSLTDKVTGLDAGADDYLLKPYNNIELEARIAACLRVKAMQDELAEKNRQLEELVNQVNVLAITDPLTGLYNRRHFEGVMSREFKKISRYGFHLSCFLLDLDFFKKVNDDYSHSVGDTVLIGTSKILLKSVRDVDIVARWGGEEFIVLLPQAGRDDALMVSERVLKNISNHKYKEMPDRQVTASIGVACAPDPAITSSEKLVDTADLAMYRAKKCGRNRVEIS